ncbi:hypothetical protein J3U01_07925 [Bifidobacterium sp. B4107]|uniref:hypothetical protein n=1 Tax=unclassified Bifidobacterium TaxID=2608897 RepID=UPI00226B2371|nr:MULTISPECIES: hypothetical protein [unclassified Bifidobacterium]MCX8648328.1 hypothetical protein [Bifidobacterium sp. B4107]MCX8652680.1 hypothetical protein [Bifidobacterium sp. B4111]MCX8658956.1 hypothetical protein [Bifidobacterium sp. B4114]
MEPDKDEHATIDHKRKQRVGVTSILLFSYYFLVTACPFILIESPNDNLSLLAIFGAVHLLVVIPFSFVLGMWTASHWARRAQDFVYYTLSIFTAVGIVAIVVFFTDYDLFSQICYFALFSILLFLAGAGVICLYHSARNRKKNKTHISK